LKDWRRLNVAITRAKSKLIMFGSLNTLKGFPLYDEMIDFISKKEWIIDAPINTFPDTSHGEKKKRKFDFDKLLDKNILLKQIKEE